MRTVMASVPVALFVSLVVAVPSSTVHEALGAAIAPPAVNLVLRPGESKCAKRVFNRIGGITLMSYRERQVSVPADLSFRTAKVEKRGQLGIFADEIIVTYCIGARQDAKPADHQVKVAYDFYFSPIMRDEKPDVTRTLSVRVRVEKP